MADEFSHSRLGRRAAVCHAQMLTLPGITDYKDKDAEVTEQGDDGENKKQINGEISLKSALSLRPTWWLPHKS